MTESEIITLEIIDKRLDNLIEKFSKLAEEIKNKNKKENEEKRREKDAQ